MKPEIYNDELFYKILEFVQKYKPKTILEIGSAEGTGSTQALIKGINHTCILFCVEVSPERFKQLYTSLLQYSFIRCINGSSVGLKGIMSESDIESFYNKHPEFNIRQYPLKTVKKWRLEDISIISKSLQQNVIDNIKKDYQIKNFNMVLIDGSAFTASVELYKVYGSKVIILDDTIDIKNYDNYNRLLKDKKYKLIKENKKLRNGYAIFKKYDSM